MATRIDAAPRLEDGDDRPDARVRVREAEGTARVYVRDSRGRERARVEVTPDDYARVAVRTGAGDNAPLGVLQAAPGGGMECALYDAGGAVRVRMFLWRSGDCGMSVHDAHGRIVWRTPKPPDLTGDADGRE